MTPGPGDDRHEGDDTEEDQHQGNRDSEDNEDDNGRDNRNDGCQDRPGMRDKEQTMGNADNETTATTMKTVMTTGTTHRPPPSNCLWVQMTTRVIWAQVIFLIFVSYFLFKIYIVSLNAIY